MIPGLHFLYGRPCLPKSVARSKKDAQNQQLQQNSWLLLRYYQLHNFQLVLRVQLFQRLMNLRKQRKRLYWFSKKKKLSARRQRLHLAQYQLYQKRLKQEQLDLAEKRWVVKEAERLPHRLILSDSCSREIL